MTLFHVGITPGKLTLNSSSTDSESRSDVPLFVVYLLCWALIAGLASFMAFSQPRSLFRRLWPSA